MHAPSLKPSRHRLRLQFKLGRPLIGMALGFGNALALATTLDFHPQLNVPDGSGSGIADVETVIVPFLEIADVNVTLNLTSAGLGGFNGDLYASLEHNGTLAILLNRPGRRTDSAWGYSDPGLAVTLDDEAPADIHTYRLTLSGTHLTPVGGALAGNWQPDGRSVDPALVTIGNARTATLAQFQGLDPNGLWTLHVVDVQSGGEVTLDSWGLELTAVAAVPEVPSPGWLLGGALAAMLAGTRWRTARFQ